MSLLNTISLATASTAQTSAASAFDILMQSNGKSLEQLVQAYLSPSARNLVQVTVRANNVFEAISRQRELWKQAKLARYSFQMLKMPIRDSVKHIEVSNRIQSDMKLDCTKLSSSATKSIVTLSQQIFQSVAEQVTQTDRLYATLEDQLREILNTERFLIFKRDVGVREFMLPLANTRAIIPSPPMSPTDSSCSSNSSMSTTSGLSAHEYTCTVCTDVKSDRDLTEMSCCRGVNSKPICYECVERNFFEKSHYGVDQFVKCLYCDKRHDVYIALTVKQNATLRSREERKRKRNE
jgi:hypothetical protein